jgi:hypothetical protein
MLTSGQVAMMMQQQNQVFAGNAAFSHQISAQMPGYQMQPAVTYGGQGGGGFSYGGGAPMGQNFTSGVSGGAVSTLGGMAQFGLGAASIGAAMGMIGGPARAVLDPFTGAGAMYNLGGRMKMGMMGSLGMGALGMLPSIGALAAGSHMIGSVVGGAQDQASIDRVLGQYNFINQGTGERGFSRQQSKAIGDMARQMQSLPELMTSMGELTRIMDKMGQMGLMQGMQNVTDFGNKFKESIKVLREMSKVMGTTMEEALPMFGEIRRSGIYSTSDILKNAMSRQIVGGLTGMSQGQVNQVAQVGAQLGFATGGSRAGGSRHAMRMAGQLGMANQMGIISNDDIVELTGMEGSAGIQALSQQLTHASYRMSRGALGTAMSIAMAEVGDDGKFTGKMDQELVEKFRRGEFSKSDMMRLARQRTSSRTAKMSYVANRDRLRSEMAGSMGVEGQMQMLGTILGERGFQNPDALRIVSQNFGLDEREAGLMVELGQKMPDIQVEMSQRGRQEARRIAQESFMKDNYSWDAVKRKASKRIENVVTEPFKQFGSDLRESISATVDDFVDEITGRYKIEVTKGMADIIRQSSAGASGAGARLSSMIESVGDMSILSKAVDMTPSRLGSVTDWLTGRTSAGDRMATTLRHLGGSYYNQTTSAGTGDTVLSRDRSIFGRDDLITASNEQQMAASAKLGVLGSGGVTDLMGVAGGVMSRDKDLMHRASSEMREVLLSNLHLHDLKGDERIDATMKLLSKSSPAFHELSVKSGKFFGGGRAEIAQAIAQFGSGEIGSGMEEAFMEAAGMFGPNINLEEIHKKRRDLDRNIRKKIGSEAYERFAAIRDAEGGDPTVGLFYASLSEGRKATNLDLLNEDIRKISDSLTFGGKKDKRRESKSLSAEQNMARGILVKKKEKRSLNDEELEYLKKKGISEDNITPEKAKEMLAVADLADVPFVGSMLMESRANMITQSIGGAKKQFLEQGAALTEQTRTLRRRADSGHFDLTEEEKAILSDLEGVGNLLSSSDKDHAFRLAAGAVEGERGAAAQLGSIAARVHGLRGGNKEALLAAGGDALRSAHSRYDLTMRRGRGRKRMTLDDIGFKASDMSEADYNTLLELTGGQKEFGQDTLQKISEYMAGGQASKDLVLAGVETGSRYANPAEVAQHMAQFGKSVVDLATIVGAMGGGESKGKGDAN